MTNNQILSIDFGYWVLIIEACLHLGIWLLVIIFMYIKIKVRPGASQTKIVGKLDDEPIKIDVAAPPERGKANIELIKFLAKEYKVDKSSVSIISGAGERVKLVKITQN